MNISVNAVSSASPWTRVVFHRELRLTLCSAVLLVGARSSLQSINQSTCSLLFSSISLQPLVAQNPIITSVVPAEKKLALLESGAELKGFYCPLICSQLISLIAARRLIGLAMHGKQPVISAVALPAMADRTLIALFTPLLEH